MTEAKGLLRWTRPVALSFADGVAPLPSYRASEAVGPRGAMDNGSQSSGMRLRMPPLVPAELSIFAGTWNLGGQGPPELNHLVAWLPPNRDVYAISLQECMHVSAFTRAALAAVGETAYVSRVHSIGSARTALGFHGYIVMLVLVRSELERSREVSFMQVAASAVTRGKKLLPKWMMQRQVRLPFRRDPRSQPGIQPRSGRGRRGLLAAAPPARP